MNIENEVGKCVFSGKPSLQRVVLPNRINFFFPRKVISFVDLLQKEKNMVRSSGVRTSGFHPGNKGSIPLRTAKIKDTWQATNQQRKEFVLLKLEMKVIVSSQNC